LGQHAYVTRAVKLTTGAALALQNASKSVQTPEISYAVTADHNRSLVCVRSLYITFLTF